MRRTSRSDIGGGARGAGRAAVYPPRAGPPASPRASGGAGGGAGGCSAPGAPVSWPDSPPRGPRAGPHRVPSPQPFDPPPALRAILSDVHGNLEALEAVLADIDARGDVSDIYCLGDVVGYGPDPCACIDLVKDRCAVTLLGNHDQASLFDPEGFNKTAERAIFWTRRTLETSRGGDARFDFLGELPRTVSEEGDSLLFVHGSARNPLNEYVFPEDIYNTPKMGKIFQLVGRRCFQGHTHIPGVFTEDFDFLAPADLDGVVHGSRLLPPVRRGAGPTGPPSPRPW